MKEGSIVIDRVSNGWIIITPGNEPSSAHLIRALTVLQGEDPTELGAAIIKAIQDQAEEKRPDE